MEYLPKLDDQNKGTFLLQEANDFLLSLFFKVYDILFLTAATICHEDMVSQSLDTALEQALSSVPSFSRKTNQQCGIGKGK